MEKYIVRWSYWLGAICAVIALAWRGLVLFGWGSAPPLVNFRYMSFFKGALLFLVLAIATSNYVWFKSQKL